MAARRPHSGGHIKFGQINLQRSHSAVYQLRQVIAEDELDVVLIQEPYSSVGRLSGLGLRTKLLCHRTAQEGRPWSAVALANSAIEPLRLLQFRTSHFTCAHIDTEIGKLFVISAYLQPSHDIELYLTHLRVILQSLREMVKCQPTPTCIGFYMDVGKHGSVARSKNYAVRKADWNKVKSEIKTRIRDVHSGDRETRQMVQEQAAEFSRCVKQGCDKGISKWTIVNNAVPWWTGEITAKRRILKSARLRYQQ
ncbi:hypothetical protein J6590_049758 [Homalodisca vitripennis]|nr:hypothetical protein J6590_092071 [Homalodisca vitripennis]KAG8301605.1 hypothetical protein J6590_049758 [Homalodisca vitripennis]